MKCQIAPPITSGVAPRPRGTRLFLRWSVALLDRILLWLERNRQRRHLRSLSNHMLKDLGLSRADVEQELRKRPWQT
ncbi:MAG: DUF1127 domain-containing protein [Rhodospirillaceae bacterium]|nr:DUF1127 domain-containing protein [Rhodospirillaceae bacterium]